MGLLGGCQANSDTNSTINIGSSYIPESIDPVNHGGGPLGRIGVYETLCHVSPTLEIQPQLASDWVVSDDGLTWIFNIRDDVQFHDGTDLTANAVKFSLERAFDSASLLSPLPVEAIEVTDTHEVKITTTKPFAPLPSYLSHRYATIVSPNSMTDSGKFDEPIATGPYVFESWNSGTELVAVKNPDYYDPTPEIDRVVFQGIRDKQTKVFSLESGELDLSLTLPASAMSNLSQTGDVETTLTETSNSRFLAYNVRRPPFDDVRVRQAVNHAINTERIVETVLNGVGSPAVGPFSPSLTDWANESLEPYGYDPERAKNLLEDAGWESTNGESSPRQKDGTSFEIVLRTYTRQPDLKTIAVTIQDQLAAVGIDVEVETTEWAALQEEMQAGETDVSLLSFAFFWVADPDRAMSFYHSEDTQIYTGYDNPDADELIERGRRETEFSTRKELYNELQTIIHRDTPLGMLTYNESISGVHSRVKNFDLHPTKYTFGLQNLRLQ
ncbi:ABC transporter substrate-binding protein [Natrialba sp. PRR66]|uniref:ABC transporter substrate-binding protein n=1 Tax=Natrialba sp. PRR66 TaxID=3098146 RepID=UPI002B1D6970|nr:ABC transporter substrate-binding protein [Natrialba sp. PRR66]